MSVSTKVDTEMVEEALDLFEQFVEAVKASGLADDPRFRAYHLAQLEGDQGGWLGGPWLIDSLREAAEGLDEENDL